ncbi:hypothetical protein MHYP_G00264430 [Metynnis hypsauchen]
MGFIRAHAPSVEKYRHRLLVGRGVWSCAATWWPWPSAAGRGLRRPQLQCGSSSSSASPANPARRSRSV